MGIMGNLVILIAAAFALWWLSKKYKQRDAGALARAGRALAGTVLIGAGVFLISRGQLIPALMAAAVGASLLGWNGLSFLGLGQHRTSRFAAALVELEVDHSTGNVDGVVRSGEYAGKRLNQLPESVLVELLRIFSERDANSARLLQLYLDRRFPGRREYAERDSDARYTRGAQSGTITKEEAYEILGLKPGASVDEIKKAYRSLMKKLHPDYGGTAYLAARVNEAKDVLLNRHR